MSYRDSGPDTVLPDEDNDAVRHLKMELAAGKPWHIALLGAIGLWTWPEENHNGRHYCYLIDGEAFDWVLLAERLSLAIAVAAPRSHRPDHPVDSVGQRVHRQSDDWDILPMGPDQQTPGLADVVRVCHHRVCCRPRRRRHSSAPPSRFVPLREDLRAYPPSSYSGPG